MPDTTQDAVSLRLTRTIKAPPQKVFDAWVDPAQRMQWWRANEDMTCDLCTFDAKVGGAYRINMKSPDGEHEYITVGEILEYDPPHRLVTTWTWEVDCRQPGDTSPPTVGTIVTLDFKPVKGGTELTLTHTGFADAPQRDDHHKGWTGCLNTLQQRLDEGELRS